MKKLLLVITYSLLLIAACRAQNINQINSRCPSPNRLVYQRILLNSAGNALFDPCPSGSSIFSGIVDFSGATVILPGGGSAVSGTGTTNYIPRWTNGAAGVLGDTPFSWDGTTYRWRNTALTNTFQFEYFPDSTNGLFSVGNASASLSIDQAAGVTNLQGGTTAVITLTGGTGTFTTTSAAYSHTGTGVYTLNNNGNTVNIGTSGLACFGDCSNLGNSTKLQITDSTSTYRFRAQGTGVGVFNLGEISSFQMQRTITAAGTTGNQTINTPLGTVNFAALATDITVTNSLALGTSLISCTVQSLDTTAISCRITNKTTGSFHIRVPAATAETSVMFELSN